MQNTKFTIGSNSTFSVALHLPQVYSHPFLSSDPHNIPLKQVGWFPGKQVRQIRDSYTQWLKHCSVSFHLDFILS